MSKIVIAYVPGLHEGYLRFFQKHANATALYLFGRSIIQGFRPLVKNIMAMDPSLIKVALDSWKIFDQVIILSDFYLSVIKTSKPKIIMPDEDECREFAAQNLSNLDIEFDPIFLRWDKKQSLNQNNPMPNSLISESAFDKSFMDIAVSLSEKSTDWWRQIGGVLICREGDILCAYNKPSLNDNAHHLFGDPRSNFKKGLHLELSLFDHAEACLIAQAAKSGIAVKGASLYVTTFPCPPCAKLIAKSGVATMYYREGYAVLDGEDVLRQNGVKIVLVR